jgi:hypothetical protein
VRRVKFVQAVLRFGMSMLWGRLILKIAFHSVIKCEGRRKCYGAEYKDRK